MSRLEPTEALNDRYKAMEERLSVSHPSRALTRAASVDRHHSLSMPLALRRRLCASASTSR
eukprot:361570-Chlamydomonas_euryale.AAC.4